MLQPQYSNARLPLIDEYDGVCRANCEPVTAPSELRFSYCNHGYSRGGCDRFPSHEELCCLRYDVVGRSETTLSVICIEERNYAPVRWHRVQYLFASDEFDPELADGCMRAQALAFCRSFVSRFGRL